MSQTAAIKHKQKPFTTKELVLTAMFSALLAVCSWISIPIGAIAFTLQTFAVFCAVNLLGGRNGLFSILVYLLLGAAGIPVFSGFKSGIGVLAGPTGGYIIGFIFIALIFWAGTKLMGDKLPVRIALMIAGLAVCYAFGTLWFVFGYSKGGSHMSFLNAMKICVFPFIPFDLGKLVLCLLITEPVKIAVKKQ